MVSIKVGDIFLSGAQTLVNTVNCVGVMGKGIALEFKKRFPDVFDDYVRRCASGKVRLGRPYLYKRSVLPWIVNFPTKAHWRSVSNLNDIVAGLKHLEKHYKDWGITSLAVPPLGCGLGNLEWRVVGPTLFRHLSRFEIPVELFAPHGTPPEQLESGFLSAVASVSKSSSAPKINPAWVGLVEILARVEREPYHWPVGRVMFQKMAYFATELGLPTGLQYARGSYGPFAGGMKQVLSALINNGLIVERQIGKMFSIKIGATYPDAAEAYADELKAWDSIIDRVVDLFLRLRTDQAEIAATVHFAAHRLLQKDQAAVTERDVFEAVLDWKRRRLPKLEEKEVARAIRNLNILKWISVKPSYDLPLPEEQLLDI